MRLQPADWMWPDVKVTIRKFNRTDIPKKVEWINNPANNRFLHYDIPITVEKTEQWFDSHAGDTSRYDAVIEADGIPVGTIGLLGIDTRNGKAEYYIAMGEVRYKGQGIATEPSNLILQYGFETLGLNRIYLFTEVDNTTAQKLFEKVGFRKEGIVRKDVLSHGQFADRYIYGLLREDWEKTRG